MEQAQRLERSEWIGWASRALDKPTGGNALALFFAWLICGAVIAVSSVIFWASFNPGSAFQVRLSLASYAETLNRDLFTQVIPNTVMVGLGTMIIALFFGFPLAWLFNRTNTPLRS